jgi:hypothetical protein
MKRRYHTALLCIIVSFVPKHAIAQAEPVSFERAVLPLLEKHCYECHHPHKTNGGLDLTQLSTMLRGGEHVIHLDYSFQRLLYH